MTDSRLCTTGRGRHIFDSSGRAISGTVPILILRLQFDTVVHCDPICRSPTLVADKTADGMPDSVRTAPRRGGCVTAEAQNTALDDFGGLLDWQRLNDWITIGSASGRERVCKYG